MNDSGHIPKKRRDAVDALFSEEGALEEILAGRGLSPGTFFSWLEEPAFSGYLRQQTRARTDAAILSAWKALLRGVERGETSAIKLFFELKAKEPLNTPALSIQMDAQSQEAAL